MNIENKCRGEYSSKCDVKECGVAFGLKYINDVQLSIEERENIEKAYRNKCKELKNEM